MPFTDTFTGTDGDDLAVYSANWTRVDGSAGFAQINASNQVKLVSPSTAGAAYIPPDCGTADHYAQCVSEQTGSGTPGFAPCVRVVDAANWIGVRAAVTVYAAFKRVGGTFTSIGSYTVTCAVGDVLRSEMSGTGYTFLLNGVSRITATVSDSVFTGVTTCGFCARAASANPYIDDWESTQSAGTTDGVGSSSGVGSASGVGASTAASAASSAGVGAASGVGASTAASVASSAGVGSASAVGEDATSGTTDGVGSSAGVATANAVGASTAAATASANGIGAVSAVGVGVQTIESVGTSAGIATALGVGADGSAPEVEALPTYGNGFLSSKKKRNLGSSVIRTSSHAMHTRKKCARPSRFRDLSSWSQPRTWTTRTSSLSTYLVC